MRLTSVLIILLLASFNSNIRFIISLKTVENTGSRSFIVFRTNTINQKPCTCTSMNSCSCCENVRIFYTFEEKKLCFNMIYQKNGLNFDIALDSLVIKSMTVASFRPFQMCAPIPGLLFSSICVNILEINQFSKSITVCPRVEVLAKKERWQINYICNSISTELPTAANTAMMPGMMMVPMTGGTMPGPMMMMIPGMMVPTGQMMSGGAAPKPPGGPAMMMPAPPATKPAPISGPAPPAMSPMPPAGMGAPMKPAPPGMMPAMAPPAGMMPAMAPPAGMMPAMAAPPAMMPAMAAPPAMMPAPPAMAPPAAMMPAPPAMAPPAAMMPAPPAMASPPSAPRPPTGPAPMMPGAQAGVIMPRPAGALVAYSPDPSIRIKSSVIDSTVQTIVPLNNADISLSPHQELISEGSNHFDTVLALPKTDTQDVPTAIMESNTKQLTKNNDETIELTGQEYSKVVKREKRNYDMFDILHQTDRCVRAYRICVTRSKHYIVSRLTKTRTGVKVKNNECSTKPARIVHGSKEDLCNQSSSSESEESLETTTPPIKISTKRPNNSSLDAIIIHDEYIESSDFHPQNSPYYTIPMTPYTRPDIFPMRTPPLIASQVKEYLDRIFNESLSSKEASANDNEFFKEVAGSAN